MGFGTLLVNIPLSSALTHVVGNGVEVGAISRLFEMGIQTELFPLLVFIAVGAMIDFMLLFQTPVTMIFGLMAQAGIFLTMAMQYLAKMTDEQTLVMYSGHPMGLFHSFVRDTELVADVGSKIGRAHV